VTPVFLSNPSDVKYKLLISFLVIYIALVLENE